MPGKYTWGETMRLARLEWKAGRRVIAAGDENAGGSDRAQERIYDRAEERRRTDEEAMRNVLAGARRDAAAAKIKVRTARTGADRRAARDEEREVARGLRRVERAARSAGYGI